MFFFFCIFWQHFWIVFGINKSVQETVTFVVLICPIWPNITLKFSNLFQVATTNIYCIVQRCLLCTFAVNVLWIIPTETNATLRARTLGLVTAAWPQKVEVAVVSCICNPHMHEILTVPSVLISNNQNRCAYFYLLFVDNWLKYGCKLKQWNAFYMYGTSFKLWIYI